MEKPAGLQIKLFGRFHASMNREPIAGLRLREGERLLAFLALQSGCAVSYRSIAENFWPAEAKGADGIHGDFPSTRQAIHNLRMALGSESWRLESTAKGVALLNLQDCQVDLVDFDRLSASASFTDKQCALDLYKGPLLDGWNDRWAIHARTDVARKFIRLLEDLIDRAERLQDDCTLERLLQRAVDSGAGNDRWESDLASCRRRNSKKGNEQPWNGGAVSLNSRYYILRAADHQLEEAISRGDSVILIKGAHQMGKSSLLARALNSARGARESVACTDLEAISDEHMVSADSLLSAIAASLIEQLGLELPLKLCWHPDLDANLNFERFVRKHILAQSEGHFVWGIDGADRLFMYPFGRGIFSLFRSWHNNRAIDPSGPWSRFTLAISYSTEAHLFITDLNQSPFNVGTRIALSDFSQDELAELNSRYNCPLKGKEDIVEFHSLINGHPFLTNRGLHELSARDIRLDELEASSNSDDGPFGGHLRGMLANLQRDPSAVEAVRKILRNEGCPGMDWLYRLRSGGIVLGNSLETVRLRCPLYQQYLDGTLI